MPRKRAARTSHQATPRPAVTTWFTRRRWPGTLLALAIGLTYANSLSGAFVLDDQATIVQNPQIRDLSRLGDVLRSAPDSPVAGRPLASLTFALNYAAGGLDVPGYHVVNIALHAGCALLVLAFVRRTILHWNVAHGGAVDAGLVAFAAALLWAVHPLNSEVVNYLSQRTESLMAACYLATLYCALRAAPPALSRSGEKARRRSGWEALAVAACLGGALSKESIATAPVVVVLFDRVFLFRSWREQWGERRRLYAGLACSWIAVGLVLATGARAAVTGLSSGISPWTYLLNQAEMITTYLRLAVWPNALVAFYGWPQAVTIADVAPSLAFVSMLVVLAGIALWRWPPIGFLAVSFFATLAPASSFVPVSTEVGAERRMYLPLVALAVLAALALDSIGRRFAGRAVAAAPRYAIRATAVIVVAGAALALAVVTMARNEEFDSALTLARTVVDRRPTAVAHHMLAEELVRAQRHDEAIPHLRQAIAGGNSRARYLLGQVLASQNRHADAIEQLDAFVRTYRPPQPLIPAWLEPPLTEVVPARFLLGRLYAVRGEWGRSVDEAQAILSLVPSHIGAHRLLGDAMFAQERWADAVEHYGAYLKRQPDDISALLNFGIAHVGIERLDGAISAFARAAELDPTNARARELLALAQEDRARVAGR